MCFLLEPVLTPQYTAPRAPFRLRLATCAADLTRPQLVQLPNA